MILCLWLHAAVRPVLAPPDSESFRAVVLATDQVTSAFGIVVTITFVNIARIFLGTASPREFLPCGWVAGSFGLGTFSGWSSGSGSLSGRCFSGWSLSSGRLSGSFSRGLGWSLSGWWAWCTSASLVLVPDGVAGAGIPSKLWWNASPPSEGDAQSATGRVGALTPFAPLSHYTILGLGS